MTQPNHDPLEWIDDELAALDQQALRRDLSTHGGAQRAWLDVDGRRLINFGSNDYLGLAPDERLSAAAAKATAEHGWGAGASPLITGHAEAHRRLESCLAEFEGTESAILFSSGYVANVGTICALADRGDAIFSDQKNHASLIDGCRLSRAAVHIYPHGDASGLRALLSQAARYRRRLIVTEGVFSMDGDLAPLDGLVKLAQQFDCMLLVDEAHATGVFGPMGRGLAEHLGLADRVPVRIGTLSKALGCSGGFVCGSRRLADWLVNRARPYVFSTAVPPPGCAAAAAALEIVQQEPSRRAELLERAAVLRQRLRGQGWNLGSSDSQIIPIIVGDAASALRLSARLRESGILAPAIRPPSVPVGQSLVRISLGYAHSLDMIESLCSALGDLVDEFASSRAQVAAGRAANTTFSAQTI